MTDPMPATKKAAQKAAKKPAKSFEESLWDTATKLRGSVEASEYKHVVLSLIFLKFVSDKFEERRAALIAEIEVIDCGALQRAEFIKIALPLFQSIRNNLLRVQTLAKLRDTLLPKLISGELRIPGTETPAI